jgi:glycosyltransferase involved in cell wall biosynthesis
MRVAVIISRIEELGPVKSTQDIVNSLALERDIQLRLYYLDEEVDQSIKFLIPVEKYDKEKFNFDRFDIIHTSGIRPDFLAFINRKRIKFHISTVRNFVFTDLRYSYNRFISWVFGLSWLILWSRADKIVCITLAMKKYYEKWYHSSKLLVIPNGISAETSSSSPDDDIIRAIDDLHSKGFRVIGTAGILTWRKGIDQVLRLLVSEREYSLLVIGNGKELVKLKRLAHRLDITSRCVFTGFRNNAVRYFKYFDLMIVPSRSEGFGRVLVEAVQQKVPVICSDISAFKEIFTSNEVTFFKLEDLNSMIQALDEAEATGNSKVETAYNKYLSNYTARIMADNYFSLYKSA